MSSYTLLVSVSLGRFFNHKQVFFCSGCPNCQGLIIWSGFLYNVDITHTGFSMAIRRISASANFIKNAAASKRKLRGFLPSVNHRAPATAKCVQGGCAMRKSHLPPSCVMPSIVSTCPPLQSLKRIAQNGPLWMSAGRLLNIAGVGLMPSCSESLANFLRFLTGNYFYPRPPRGGRLGAPRWVVVHV